MTTDAWVRPSILVAPADSLRALQEQLYLQDSAAFTDTDTDRAFDVILDLKPAVVALERRFAESPAGQAFAARITSHPALEACVTHAVGVRRVPRYTLTRRVDIVVDGSPARLLDISTAGALIVAASSLKPKQQVRLAFRAGDPPWTATVIWAHFELASDGPRYRAGVQFPASAADAVAVFMDHLT